MFVAIPKIVYLSLISVIICSHFLVYGFVITQNLVFYYDYEMPTPVI